MLNEFDILKLEPNIKIKKQMIQKIILTIKEHIFNRQLFKYGYLDIFQYLLCWVFLRRKTSIKKSLFLRNQRLYSLGSHKLRHELDLVSIIRSIRQFKIINKMLLNKNSNLMMRFNNTNVIDSTSWLSDNSNINILKLIKGDSITEEQQNKQIIWDVIWTSWGHWI